MVTSTTTVVDVGPDDLEALQRVASDIADARDLAVVVRPHVGWCAVHFSRRERAPN
jgi:hypothetical protein